MNRYIVLILLVTSALYAARTHNGTDQWFEAACSDYNEPAQSFSAWFQTDSNTVEQSLWIISDQAVYTDYVNVFIASDGTMTGRVRRSGEYAVNNPNDVSTGEWHHVAFVWEADDDMYLWFDGERSSGTNSGNARPVDINTMAIGCKAAGGDRYNEFDGYIADVGFWYGTALSGAQVANLYSDQYSPELVGTATSTWRLNESASTDSAVDAEGTNTLTDYGSPGTTSGPSGIVYSLDSGNYFMALSP